MADLLAPIEVDIELPDGSVKKFILSKFPAVAGREIITQYPTSAAPKIGSYALNEELMFKLMSYVAVPLADGLPLRLNSRALVDNHVPDFETLMRIEWEMMKYNCSFFSSGAASGFLELLMTKAEGLITKTLISFSEQLSSNDKPPSKN